MALATCEVGPDYQRPDLPQPVQYKSDATTRPATHSAALSAQWWNLYHDERLDDLMAEAQQYNQNLRQAIARVDEARALAKVAASYLYPTITFDPSYTLAHESGRRVSSVTGTTTPEFTYTDVLVPVDLTYEVDIWGRVRRQLETSQALTRASEFDLGVVRLTMQTDLAVYYFALRSLDAQTKILSDNVNAYKEQVRIVSVQLKNGLVPPSDLDQAKAQLQATLAQLRDTQRSRADEEHALAVICGRPASFFIILDDPLENPTPPAVTPGLPAQLLVRRPDVAEAEQNLIAANAQVGVAVANFYPVFTLTGDAGFESASFRSIFDWQSKMASIMPSVSVPIFEGGRLRSNLEYQKARRRELAAAYINQVLTAYSDVENALTDLHAYADEVQSLQEAVRSSESYHRVANVQYRGGLVNYLIVTDAERTLLGNQLSLAQTVNQQMAASVHLIQALGGGWDPNSTPPAK